MRYKPTYLGDDKDIVFKLNTELQRLEIALNNSDPVTRTFHVEPPERQDGYQAIADGSDWNPGAGAGLYIYYNETWHVITIF